MTYTPNVWADGDCVMAADMNNIENGVDRAQGDVMVLRGLLAALPVTDPLLVGRLYFATDTSELFRDNGAGWDQVFFDHGDLIGLGDNDHPQYIEDAEFAALGDILVGTGAATFANLGVGAAGEVLTVAGGTATWAAAAAAGGTYRYYWALQTAFASLVTTAVAGRVHTAPIDIPWNVTIDRILIQIGTVTAGNIRVGIYDEAAAPDSPVGGALQVESASVAAAPVNQMMRVAIPNTALTAGRHYLAVQSDSTILNFRATYETANIFADWFANSIGYGAFDNPCPAVNNWPLIAAMGVRVV